MESNVETTLQMQRPKLVNVFLVIHGVRREKGEKKGKLTRMTPVFWRL
jgi:hypothetical protein